jgi:hypothetical protein
VAVAVILQVVFFLVETVEAVAMAPLPAGFL